MSTAQASEEAEEDVVAAVMTAMGPDVLNRMNVDFEDAILMVGRVLGERPDATAARITWIDSRGVDVLVSDPVGEHPGRIDFTTPITEPHQLTDELLGLVARAREVSGEEGLTSAEVAAAEVASARTFLTQVTAVEDIHPHLRQITFGGGDLRDLNFAPVGPDTFLFLLVPPPGRTELGIDQSFTWEQHERMPEAERPVGAYYTVRRWRPEPAELDVLFVLHEDPGPASAWAAQAQPGNPVALWGPRTAFDPPAGTDRYLLVADETGLPAVAVILEQLPAGVTARVFAEVGSPEEHHDLPDSPAIEVTWLYRNGAAPGTTTLLPDAVKAMPWPAGDGTTPYVWGGGESHTMTAVRRYVRDTIGLAREAVDLVAYWRKASDR